MKIKKLLPFLLLSICFVFGLRCNVNAETYTGDGYTLEYGIMSYDSDDSEYYYISIDSITTTASSVNVSIPETIDNIPVTEINGGAFADCAALTDITIPDSIMSIGGYAFYNCTSLTNITIPDSVTTIDDYAIGYEGGESSSRVDGFIIYAPSGSQAELYAQKNYITFIELKASDHTHTYGDWTITKTASCTTNGTQTRTCSLCGNTTILTIPATGHKYGSWKVTKAATCTTAGSQTRTCSICGNIETQTIPATGHKYGSWKVTKAATVFKTGSHTRSCTICKKNETKSIAKLKASIKLSKTKLTLKKKKSSTITVSYAKGDSVKSWKSSNKKIATVTSKGSKGKITAKKKGKTTITVTLKSGKKAKVTITVK